jgi:hypothetical protein
MSYPNHYEIEIENRNQSSDGARMTFGLGRKGERADRRFRAGLTIAAK